MDTKNTLYNNDVIETTKCSCTLVKNREKVITINNEMSNSIDVYIKFCVFAKNKATANIAIIAHKIKNLVLKNG